MIVPIHEHYFETVYFYG